jgi:hypothetical protein
MSTTATATAAPKKTQPRKQRTFRILFVIEGVTYTVVPLQPDPGVATKAYELHRRDPKGKVTASYAVHVNGHGPECECRGFLRWGYCKHLQTLAAAGMIPAIPTSKNAKPSISTSAPEQPMKGGTSDGTQTEEA